MTAVNSPTIFELNENSDAVTRMARLHAALELQTIIHCGPIVLSEGAGALINQGMQAPFLSKSFALPHTQLPGTRLFVSARVRAYNKAHGTHHESHSVEWHQELLSYFLAGASMHTVTTNGLQGRELEAFTRVNLAYLHAMRSEHL